MAHQRISFGTLVLVVPCHALGEIVGRTPVAYAGDPGSVCAYRVRLPNGAVVRFEPDALLPFVGPGSRSGPETDPPKGSGCPVPASVKDAA